MVKAVTAEKVVGSISLLGQVTWKLQQCIFIEVTVSKVNPNYEYNTLCTYLQYVCHEQYYVNKIVAKTVFNL